MGSTTEDVGLNFKRISQRVSSEPVAAVRDVTATNEPRPPKRILFRLSINSGGMDVTGVLAVVYYRSTRGRKRKL